MLSERDWCLEIVDLRNIAIGNNGSMDFAFDGLHVESIIGLREFCKGPILSMEKAFRHVTTDNLDLRDWNISNVKSLNDVFAGARCKYINISGWDVSKVESAENMFSRCKCRNLVGMDSLNWIKLYKLSSMFYQSELDNVSLKGLRGISSMDHNIFNSANIYYLDISGLVFESTEVLRSSLENSYIHVLDIRGAIVYTVNGSWTSFQTAYVDEMFIDRSLLNKLGSQKMEISDNIIQVAAQERELILSGEHNKPGGWSFNLAIDGFSSYYYIEYIGSVAHGHISD
jgi:uncharacterized protein YjbI with pentapeptide repeats